MEIIFDELEEVQEKIRPQEEDLKEESWKEVSHGT